MRKRPMAYILVLVLGAFLATNQLLLYLILRLAWEEGSGITPEARQALIDDLVLPAALPSVFAYVQNLGSIMLIILAAVSFGGEFGWGTIRLLLGRGVGRAQFVLSKLLVLAGWTTFFIVAGLVTGFVASLVITLLEGRDLGAALTGLAIRSLPAMAARTYYALLIYLLLTAFATVATRSTAAGMAIALVYYFLESLVNSILGLVVEGPLSRALHLLIGINVQALMSANGPRAGAASAANNLPSPTQAALVLAVYGITFLLYSVYLFQRRDIQAGGGQ